MKQTQNSLSLLLVAAAVVFTTWSSSEAQRNRARANRPAQNRAVRANMAPRRAQAHRLPAGERRLGERNAQKAARPNRQAHEAAQAARTRASLEQLGADANHPAVVRAQTYANAHDFPIRVVEAGSENRRVRRAFVPITEETFQAFSEHFTSEDSLVLRFTANNNHLVMALKPGDNYLWARNYIGERQGLGDYRNMYNSFSGGGYTMAVRMTRGVEHLRNWLGQRADPNDQLYCKGNCMEWLPNAEVAENRAFFHELGIRRSRDGRNMKAKLLHAATEVVDVIGVHVENIEAFNQLSNDDLIGPPPSGGTEDAARD